ncbi:group III truncated hemoglobin [Methylobacter sp.]|uniref:group III truncated hemoglobin n=1 Tax=Methylobacter sp. TaxID=2051955 RepID=UPI002FDD93CE
MTNTQNSELNEQHIVELVRRFYERALDDDSLRPIFEAVIHDWDEHHRVVENFWSYALLKTDRYRNSPYSVHVPLPLQPEHFDHWLTLFRETATEELPPSAATEAIARAEHMAESFKAGMLNNLNLPSRPSRAGKQLPIFTNNQR